MYEKKIDSRAAQWVVLLPHSKKDPVQKTVVMNNSYSVIALNKSTVLFNFINFYFINLLCKILWKPLLVVYLHRVYSRSYLNCII